MPPAVAGRAVFVENPNSGGPGSLVEIGRAGPEQAAEFIAAPEFGESTRNVSAAFNHDLIADCQVQRFTA